MSGDDQFLKIKILNAWGSIKFILHYFKGSQKIVGLTEIKLFDEKNNTIDLKSYNLKTLNVKSMKSPDILINNVFETMDANNMWVSTLPEPPKNIEIIVN